MPKCATTALKMFSLIFRGRDAEIERRFLEHLTVEEAEIYRQGAEGSWYPVEMMVDYLNAVAAVLHPYDPQGIHRVGWELARNGLTDIHKVEMRLMPPPDLIGRIADMWSQYFDQGRPRSGHDPDQNHGLIVIEGYPEMSEVLRQAVGGVIDGVLSLAGAGNARVSEDVLDPNAWRWDVVWE